jgi:chromosomal replication initiator protein
MSFARFLTFPENKLALLAIRELASNIASRKPERSHNPILLHGTPGTGKTHLVYGLATELAGKADLAVQFACAEEFREPTSLRFEKKRLAVDEAAPMPTELVESAQECDVFILEDLQHLPLFAAEALVQIIDHRQAHQRPMVFTASMGPRHLANRQVPFPARLTSRLAAGLVVALEPLKTPSRRRFLEEMAQRRQLALPRDIVPWLAQNLTGGGRQLEGAISQLETLNKVSRQPLDLKSVIAHFQVQVDATRPTVERIACKVGGYFQIEPRQLQSRRRSRIVLWPRQISMYLARQLTVLSLDKIGAYFGGRDHTTVLHACKKVEKAIKKDAVLSGAVRQIHAELG